MDTTRTRSRGRATGRCPRDGRDARLLLAHRSSRSRGASCGDGARGRRRSRIRRCATSHAARSPTRDSTPRGRRCSRCWRPSGRRRATTRLLVAFQIMYDYLDALTEQPTPEPLRTSRQLHLALLVALGAPGARRRVLRAPPARGRRRLPRRARPRPAARSSPGLPGAGEAAPHAIRAAAPVGRGAEPEPRSRVHDRRRADPLGRARDAGSASASAGGRPPPPPSPRW